MAITRLSGGTTPANGSDPRTFPAIWNDTADDIEAAEAAIAVLQGDVSAIEAWDLDDINDVVITSATTGQVLKYDGTNWINGTDASGKILQVVSTSKTNTFSMSSSTFADVTDLSVTITPSSDTSKILVLANISIGTDFINYGGNTRITRNSTPIYIGDADGSRDRVSASATGRDSISMNTVSPIYLDSPATSSALTYSLQVSVASGTLSVNSCLNTDNSGNRPRGVSSITVMEVAG